MSVKGGIDFDWRVGEGASIVLFRRQRTTELNSLTFTCQGWADLDTRGSVFPLSSVFVLFFFFLEFGWVRFFFFCFSSLGSRNSLATAERPCVCPIDGSVFLFHVRFLFRSVSSDFFCAPQNVAKVGAEGHVCLFVFFFIAFAQSPKETTSHWPVCGLGKVAKRRL